jgi:hypothetical protein
MSVKNNKLNIKITNKNELKEKINGYISYFKGAPDYTFPKSNINILKCKMSDF